MSVSPTNSELSSSTSASSPSSTSTSNGSGNALNSSSSLLFGFLVSVLSLFGLFMMSGLIWHRLVIRRRMIDEMLRVNSTLSQKSELRKPQLCDVLAVPGHGYLRWRDTQPLAAEKQEMTSPPPQDSQAPRSSFWKRLISRTPREITYLFSPPSIAQVVESPLSSHPRMELPVDNSHVQVSVLIAMPQGPDPLLNSSKGIGLEKYRSLYEIVIGSTNVLYHDSDSDSD